MRANPKNYKVKRLEGVNMGENQMQISDMATQYMHRFEFANKEAFGVNFTRDLIFAVCHLSLSIPVPPGSKFIIHWHDKK